MENEAQPITPLVQNPTPTPPSTSLLKIILFVVLGLVVVSGSVFAGIQIGKNQSSSQDLSMVETAATPTQVADKLTASPTTTMSPTESTISLKTYTTTKLSEANLPSITFNYYSDWIIDEKNDGLGDLNLKLSKDGYVVTLHGGPMGGSVCLFDDSPNFEGPSSDFRALKYTEINSNFGTLRYFINPSNPQGYSFCQKSKSDGSFGFPLQIGVLNINVGTKTDTKVFQEAIDIVKSISIN